MQEEKPKPTTGKIRRRRSPATVASSEYALFEFITDEGLRSSLKSDCRELQIAVDNGLWKSVHVLAGSILEAVLIDYLANCAQADEDPTNLSLATAVTACVKEGALSKKAADLTSALRQYRNLIHPGRGLRLQEEVSEGSAKVVAGILEICIREIVRKKRAVYGDTAEQIIHWLERSPSSLSILSPVLKNVRGHELERLLKLIPYRYLMASALSGPAHMPQALVTCFHAAFGLLSDEKKRNAARNIVAIIREQPEAIILGYETAFFTAPHLGYLGESDREMVKKHLLSRFLNDRTATLFRAVRGIEAFLSKEEVSAYADYLVTIMVWGENDLLKKEAGQYVTTSYSSLPEGCRSGYLKRLRDWEAHFKKSNQTHWAAELTNITSHLLGIESMKLFSEGMQNLLSAYAKKAAKS